MLQPLRGIFNFKFSFFIFVVFALCSVFFVLPVHAECGTAPNSENLQCQIDEITSLIAKFKPAQDKNKADLAAMRSQIAGINSKIAQVSKNLTRLSQDIEDRQASLSLRQNVFEEKTKRHYMVLRQQDPLAPFLLADSATDLLQQIAIRSRVIAQDQEDILKLAQEIDSLEKDKETLTKSRASLQIAQTSLDKKAGFLAGEVAKVEKYLQGLTSKQQSLIAAKLASLNIPRTAYAGIGGGCSSDLTNGKNPGFSPAFGLFTYGVPNRVGLNQYGAKGRAEAGQNYTQILNAYYNFSMGSSGNPSIHVSGTNNYGQSIDTTLPLEEYLKHIYEMPSGWPAEALKAQVIAARSYALSATNNGTNSICPSDHCQEFKQEQNAQAWIDAVNSTTGQIMTSDGQPITAWFSSTHGGYIYSSGGDVGGAAWTKNAVDTTTGSVSGFGDLASNAYDKDSPWFYCDWGSRSQYGGTAWLKGDEMADIVNAILLASRVSPDDRTNYLVQTDKNSGAWNSDTVKQKLKDDGITPFSSISSINVDVDFGSGHTNSVNVSGDAPSQNINGTDFKNYFNLRAPANLQIVGPLYNIERR